MNTIIVSGTNRYNSAAADTVTITRLTIEPGDGPPVVDVISTNATVPFPVAAHTIAGTNNAHVVGTMWWTNALSGQAGMRPAALVWTITGIVLPVGSSVITVSGTNLHNAVASDTVTTCPWKGQASYFTIVVGDRSNDDAAMRENGKGCDQIRKISPQRGVHDDLLVVYPFSVSW